MNIDLEAIRNLQQNKEAICEDMALRSQSEQLRGARATARLERMTGAKVNQLTLNRLAEEAQDSAVRAEQYHTVFNTLRCSLE